MRTILIFLFATFITACASDPDVRWATAQSGYNSAVETVNIYRRPCVPGQGVENAGPDHPRCLVDDDTMRKIALVKSAADITVRQLEAAAHDGGGPRFEALLTEFEHLLAQILLSTPTR